MQQGAPPELRRQKLHIVYKQMTPTEFLIWETILEYEEYHSITYKPIIAPEQHPVVEIRILKTNRAPEERPVLNHSVCVVCSKNKRTNRNSNLLNASLHLTMPGLQP